MALWGNKDSLSNLTGTISIDLGTEEVIGSGTSFVTAGISTGDVLVVGTGATYGQAVVTGITSETLLSIGSTQFLIPLSGAIAGAAYTVSQKPKYTLEDGQYYAPDEKENLEGAIPYFSSVFGVDSVEVGTARTVTVGSKAGAYAVAHSGWVGVTTYVDNHGNLRVKSEVLVAGGISAPDADDDTKFPDPTITILTDVADVVGIATTGVATFSVVASVFPDYAPPLTYQWYEDTTILSDGGDYSGTTTSILTVQNDSDKDDGREYSAVISSGDTSVTSGVGTITYV